METLEQERHRVFGTCGGKCGDPPCIAWNEANPQRPRFKHDCEECVYLGRFEEYDLYFCEQGTIPTVIARYGDDGAEYTSGIDSGLSSLIEARRRAEGRGLHPNLPSHVITLLERVQHRLWESSERTECGSPEERAYLDAYEHIREIRIELVAETVNNRRADSHNIS